MEDPVIQTRTPLWARITLFVSLALNLLILGAVVGVFLTGGPERRANDDRRDLGTLYTRALSPEDRKALRREFLSGLERQGRDGSAIVGDMQTALNVLRSSPFDPDAFRQALADQSDRRSMRERVGREALATRIAEMTDAERAAYADRVEQGLMDLARRIRR